MPSLSFSPLLLHTNFPSQRRVSIPTSPVNLMKGCPIAFSINIPIPSDVNNECKLSSFSSSLPLSPSLPPSLDDVGPHLLSLWWHRSLPEDQREKWDKRAQREGGKVCFSPLGMVCYGVSAGIVWLRCYVRLSKRFRFNLPHPSQWHEAGAGLLCRFSTYLNTNLRTKFVKLALQLASEDHPHWLEWQQQTQRCSLAVVG